MIVNKDMTERTGRSSWLTTFADISALMLAFFVMLFSMSSLEVEKWQAVVARLPNADPSKEKLRPPPNSALNVATVDVPPALPLGYLSQVLEEKISQDEVLGRAQIHRLDKLVIVSLPTERLFLSAGATLTESAKEALFRLTSALAQMGNQIDVYGHTAPGGTDSASTMQNWRLSLARAVAVANELRRIGYQRNVTMLGLGDSRYDHLDRGIVEDRRRQLARRVDIVIHPTAGEP